MTLPFSFLNLNSTKNRAVISGAGVASYYGLLQYASPGLLDVGNLMADPINPIILVPPMVAAGGVFLPKLLGIKMPGINLGKIVGNRQKTGSDETNKQYIESDATLLEFGKGPSNGNVTAKNDVPADAKQVTAATPSSSTPPAASPQPQSTVLVTNDPPQGNSGGMAPQQNNSQLSDMIESKTGRITEEVESVKKDMTSLKDDIQTLKTDIKDLTSTFESSLVELKAFQSEMVNPVNFMRKYFELLDIKNVSDPVNAMMPIEQLVSNNAPDTKQSGNKPAVQNRTKISSSESHAKTIDRSENADSQSETQAADEFSIEDVYGMMKRQRMTSEDSEDYQDRRVRRPAGYEQSMPATRSRMKDKNFRKKSSMLLGDDNAEFIRSSIESGLTPGKIMSIVSIVDEILASMGPDGIDLVLEQYRAIGLKPEEERLIYGVVKMLNESKLLTDDIIAMLYRFGQVLGINDEDAELQYMKIVANKRNKKKRISRDMMASKGDE